MVKQIDKNEARLRRHRRVRNKISGTAARPRLDVFRSAKHIYAQIIDDEAGKTLCSASTMEKSFEGFGGNAEAAKKVGLALAEKAKAAGINVEVEQVDSAAWSDMKKNGGVDCGISNWYVDYSDPESMLYPVA